MRPAEFGIVNRHVDARRLRHPHREQAAPSRTQPQATGHAAAARRLQRQPRGRRRLPPTVRARHAARSPRPCCPAPSERHSSTDPGNGPRQLPDTPRQARESRRRTGARRLRPDQGQRARPQGPGAVNCRPAGTTQKSRRSRWNTPSRPLSAMPAAARRRRRDRRPRHPWHTSRRRAAGSRVPPRRHLDRRRTGHRRMPHQQRCNPPNRNSPRGNRPQARRERHRPLPPRQRLRCEAHPRSTPRRLPNRRRPPEGTGNGMARPAVTDRRPGRTHEPDR